LNILILGTSGVHHTLIAANMLLDRFKGELTTMKGYCDTWLDRSGCPIYVGTDRDGHRVYTLGVGRELKVARKALGSMLELFRDSPHQVVVTEITIQGELWIRMAMLCSHLPWGRRVNELISGRVLRGQLPRIQSQVERLRAQIGLASGEGGNHGALLERVAQ